MTEHHPWPCKTCGKPILREEGYLTSDTRRYVFGEGYIRHREYECMACHLARFLPKTEAAQ